mmetsp:Transcript_2966/g.8940  ORF Transcript_2966/g.8940 Transcript_2966/m.8940 type:complete len:258 (+) Transcript_2966:412-1185(+)
MRHMTSGRAAAAPSDARTSPQEATRLPEVRMNPNKLPPSIICVCVRLGCFLYNAFCHWDVKLSHEKNTSSMATPMPTLNSGDMASPVGPPPLRGRFGAASSEKCITATHASAATACPYWYFEYCVPFTSLPINMLGNILTDFAITWMGKETYFNISYPAHVLTSLVKANANMDWTGAPSDMRCSVSSMHREAQTMAPKREDRTSTGEAMWSWVTNISFKMPYVMKQPCSAATIIRLFIARGRTTSAGTRSTRSCSTT